jgi:hypothetical protein
LRGTKNLSIFIFRRASVSPEILRISENYSSMGFSGTGFSLWVQAILGKAAGATQLRLNFRWKKFGS